MRTYWGAIAVVMALIGALLTGAAWAQETKSLSTDDQKRTVELQERAQRIDAAAAKTSTPEGQQRVTDAIAKEFKVSDNTVTTLHDQKKLGFGEVTITLALAQELSKRDKISMSAATDQILARREAGAGWGKIANDLGFKLGRVVADVHRTEKKVTAVERAERKQDRTGKGDKDDRLDKADRSDKMDRADKPEKPERAERPGRR